MVAQAVRLTDIDIDNALKNKDFDVIFQPIYQLCDGALLRLEAFVRWTHPGLGTLPPGAFISFFETQGRMSELTRYVIETALEEYVAWRGTTGPGFSVNLAFSDISDKTFPAYLKKLLKKHNFPPEYVTLECPCPPTSDEMLASQKAYEALRKTGVQLAIEVRGRTNETLRTLSPFPFNEVKTGGSAILRFARTVRGGPGMTAISELLELAREHTARTIAVGVEDQASLSALNSLGFSGAQGNHLTGVSHLADFDVESIAHVRACLRLEPLESTDSLSGLPDDGAQQTDTTNQQEAPDSDIESETEKAALKEKRRLALIAAKKRAVKKAAQAKLLEKKAALEQAAQKRQEEETAAKVEKNVRKLQNRLNKAFDIPGMDDDQDQQDVLELTNAADAPPEGVTDSTAPDIDTETTESTEPTETPEPMAEKINETPAIGAAGPSDADTPHRASDLLSHEERERLGIEEEETVSANEIAAMDTAIAETPETPSNTGESEKDEPENNPHHSPSLDPFAHLASIRSSVNLHAAPAHDASITPAPVAPLSRIAKATMMAGSITDSDFNPHAPRPTAAQPAPSAPAQESFATATLPAAEEDLHDQDTLENLNTEDEILDEAFETTDTLNPEAFIDEDETTYTEEESSVEAAIAARLAQPRSYAPPPGNFLTRKHKIYSGYFWPHSWRMAMARRRNHARYAKDTYSE